MVSLPQCSSSFLTLHCAVALFLNKLFLLFPLSNLLYLLQPIFTTLLVWTPSIAEILLLWLLNAQHEHWGDRWLKPGASPTRIRNTTALWARGATPAAAALWTAPKHHYYSSRSLKKVREMFLLIKKAVKLIAVRYQRGWKLRLGSPLDLMLAMRTLSR